MSMGVQMLVMDGICDFICENIKMEKGILTQRKSRKNERQYFQNHITNL
jgi:hypothetical protein